MVQKVYDTKFVGYRSFYPFGIRILNARPFENIREIWKVRGTTPKTVEGIRRKITAQ